MITTTSPRRTTRSTLLRTWSGPKHLCIPRASMTIGRAGGGDTCSRRVMGNNRIIDVDGLCGDQWRLKPRCDRARCACLEPALNETPQGRQHQVVEGCDTE